MPAGGRSLLCLNDVYPGGFMIPRRFIGEHIIHLPTVKGDGPGPRCMVPSVRNVILARRRRVEK